MTLIERASGRLHRRPWLATVLGVLSFGLIAVSDLLTPESVSFALFYLVPVVLLVWFDGLAWAWLLALGGALLWPVDHLLQGDRGYFESLAAYWEPAVRLGFYTVFMVSLGIIKGSLAKLRAANRELHDSEERYREVFTNSSSGIMLLDVTPDLRFRVVAINPAVEKLVGLRSDQVAGRFVDDVLAADSAEILVANYRQVATARQPLVRTGTVDVPAGRKDFHTTIIPIVDAAGAVHRLLTLPTDLTEKHRAEEALRESEQRYREVFENTSDGVFLIDVLDRKSVV
jgi:PAS domain S-box-containing protein